MTTHSNVHVGILSRRESLSVGPMNSTEECKCMLPYQLIFEFLICANLFSCIVENYLDGYH